MLYARIIGILIGVFLAVYGYRSTKGIKKNLLWVFSALCIVQGVIQIIEIALPAKSNLTQVDLENIRKILQKPQQDLQNFTDGLPTTDNKKLRRLYDLGQVEDARAAKISEAIRKGQEQDAKHYYQATLKAIEFYKQGLAANPKTSERCALQNFIGVDYFNISRQDEAVAAWQDVDKLANEMLKSDDPKINFEGKVFSATASGNLGAILVTSNELYRAEELTKKALNIHETLGNFEGKALCYSNLGVIYLTWGELDRAEGMFQKALESDVLLSVKKRTSTDYSNLGNVFHSRGELDKAEEMYMKALVIDKDLGNKYGIAADYGNLGSIYIIRSDNRKAEQYFRPALKLFREMNRKIEIKQTEDNLRAIGKEP